MLSKLYEVLKNEKFFLYSGKALTFFVLFFKDSDVSLSYVCFSFFTLLLIIHYVFLEPNRSPHKQSIMEFESTFREQFYILVIGAFIFRVFNIQDALLSYLFLWVAGLIVIFPNHIRRINNVYSKVTTIVSFLVSLLVPFFISLDFWLTLLLISFVAFLSQFLCYLAIFFWDSKKI